MVFVGIAVVPSAALRSGEAEDKLSDGPLCDRDRLSSLPFRRTTIERQMGRALVYILSLAYSLSWLRLLLELQR